MNGAVVLVTNSWIYPTSDGNNGGSVYFRVGGLNVVDTNSGFNANLLGYLGGASAGITNGYGPGAGVGGQFASGGGYGGAGGHAYSPAGAPGTGGQTYGSSNAPVLPGSGGGGCNFSSPAAGGAGGGLIWVDAGKGNVTVNGLLTAKGGAAPAGGYGPGGGSGGGVYVICKSFAGAASGKLLANSGAGAGWGAPGGGGRIAVWATSTDGWLGIASASGVTNATVDASRTDGATGTVVWGEIKIPRGTVLMIR